MIASRARDLDMSDVFADAARMEAKFQAEEDARLEREIGPMHWVMDEEEAAFSDWCDENADDSYWEWEADEAPSHS